MLGRFAPGIRRADGPGQVTGTLGKNMKNRSGRRGQADFCCRLQPAAREDIDILFARFSPHDVLPPRAEGQSE